MLANSSRFFNEGDNIFRNEEGVLVEYYPPGLIRELDESIETRIGMRIPEGYIEQESAYAAIKDNLKKAGLDWSLDELLSRFEESNPDFVSKNPRYKVKDPRPGVKGLILEKKAVKHLREFISDIARVAKRESKERGGELLDAHEVARRMGQPFMQVEKGLIYLEREYPSSVRTIIVDGKPQKRYVAKIVLRKLPDIMKRLRLKY